MPLDPPPAPLLLTALWLGVNVIAIAAWQDLGAGMTILRVPGPGTGEGLDAGFSQSGWFSLFAHPPIYEELPDFRALVAKAHKTASISAARFAAMRELLHGSRQWN